MNRFALTLAVVATTVALAPAAFAQHMGPADPGAGVARGPVSRTVHRAPVVHRSAYRSARFGVVDSRLGSRGALLRPYARPYLAYRPYGYRYGYGGAVIGAAALPVAAYDATYYGVYGYPPGDYGYGANYYSAYTSGYYGCGRYYYYCQSCGCGTPWGWGW